jgi:hypothetical protein
MMNTGAGVSACVDVDVGVRVLGVLVDEDWSLLQRTTPSLSHTHAHPNTRTRTPISRTSSAHPPWTHTAGMLPRGRRQRDRCGQSTQSLATTTVRRARGSRRTATRPSALPQPPFVISDSVQLCSTRFSCTQPQPPFVISDSVQLCSTRFSCTQPQRSFVNSDSVALFSILFYYILCSTMFYTLLLLCTQPRSLFVNNNVAHVNEQASIHDSVWLCFTDTRQPVQTRTTDHQSKLIASSLSSLSSTDTRQHVQTRTTDHQAQLTVSLHSLPRTRANLSKHTRPTTAGTTHCLSSLSSLSPTDTRQTVQTHTHDRPSGTRARA